MQREPVHTQITWTWLCTRGKKRYKYCSFSHTNRSFRVLGQWFSNLSWVPPTTAYFVCLPHLTHLIQLISSLVESARLKMGVAYEGDIQNVWWLGVPRTGLRTIVLGHQCVVTMGNCLIWISLCMFFFPLIETVTYTCHYMTDRLERFDLKTSKLDLLKKKKTPTSWMPLG